MEMKWWQGFNRSKTWLILNCTFTKNFTKQRRSKGGTQDRGQLEVQLDSYGICNYRDFPDSSRKHDDIVVIDLYLDTAGNRRMIGC